MAYLVMRVVFAKLCWKFDWEVMNGDTVDWDRDLRLYIVWQKPEVMTRLVLFEGN